MDINLAAGALGRYKESMKPTNQKKSEMIGVMCAPALKEEISVIAASEERTLSYTAGALLLRGLAAYRRDGRLREPSENNNGEHATAEVRKAYDHTKVKKKRAG